MSSKVNGNLFKAKALSCWEQPDADMVDLWALHTIPVAILKDAKAAENDKGVSNGSINQDKNIIHEEEVFEDATLHNIDTLESALRASIMRRNKRRDNGKPWQSPCSEWKKGRGRTIDENTERYIGDTTNDPFDEFDGEAQMSQNHTDVEPIWMVESFGEVNLEDDAFAFFSFDRVKGLLSSSNGLMDLSVMEES